MADRLTKARRVVVKIGSALLVGDTDGRVRRSWLETLAHDIAAARARGQEVVIVTSGAIALGRRRLGLALGNLRLDENQAAAACGQIHLAHAYEEALGHHDLRVAQVLMTLDDTEARRRYLNALGTINRLLKLGAVPVVNENDTVATSEIRFGDNDRLAARVAAMISADVLVLLSDIDGFYSADPKKNADAEHIPEIKEITPEIAAMAGKAPPAIHPAAWRRNWRPPASRSRPAVIWSSPMAIRITRCKTSSKAHRRHGLSQPPLRARHASGGSLVR